MKCFNCLGEYSSNLLKCPYCGVVNPEPVQENSCPNCHSVNSIVNDVCTKCGYKNDLENSEIINNEKIEEISSKVTKGVNLYKKISLILFLLFMGLIFLLFYLLKTHSLNVVKIIEVGKIIFLVIGITTILVSIFYKKSKILCITGVILTSLVLLFHLFSPLQDISNKKELIIDGVSIPTLYKYTNYNKKVLISMNIKNEIDPELGKVNYSFIVFNEPIPSNVINSYITELTKLGFIKINYQGIDMYVKNISNKCIAISILNYDIQYNVFDNNYQNLFKEER